MATSVPASELRSFRITLTSGRDLTIPSAYLAEDGQLGFTFRDADHKVAAVFPAGYVYEVLSLQAGITANRWNDEDVTDMANAVLRADRASRLMSKTDVAELPENAAYAISILQGVAETLQREHPWLRKSQES